MMKRRDCKAKFRILTEKDSIPIFLYFSPCVEGAFNYRIGPHLNYIV